MGIKDAFLNKGWAGKTMSRPETIERINPLIRRHMELNHAYSYAINQVSEREAAGKLEAQQKTARADVGKLSETVLSAGGVAYTGVDIEPADYALADGTSSSADASANESAMIRRLGELEQQFQELLSDELNENHQIRTRAILSVVQANSHARIQFLRGLAKNRGRSY